MEGMLKDRERKHVQEFWEKTQDEEIKKRFPFTVKSLEEALTLFEEAQKETATSYGKVIYHQGSYVGDIWCYGVDEENEKMAMLSVVIFEKKLWGKGIGQLATKAFIEEVFGKFDLEKIGAFTYSENLASIGLLKKTGFVEIDEFVEDGIASKYFEVRKK